MRTDNYWWCPNCKEEIEPHNVTYQEIHELCGCRVQWIENIPLTRIEEIFAAERDGRCVVLPCQLGQKVWYISDGKIDYGFAKWFESDEKDGWTVAVANPPRGPVYLKFECFGNIAFLSSEAAEAALKKKEEL